MRQIFPILFFPYQNKLLLMETMGFESIMPQAIVEDHSFKKRRSDIQTG
jgi:hypothetical protein